MNKFRHYITDMKFLFTQITILCFLMNNAITNGRFTRWLVLLQESNITIMDHQGKENQVTNFLSRLNTKGENILVNDECLDGHLFVISTHSPWFVDIANYLATRKLLQHLSSKEKRRIIRLSDNYSWMEGYLYHIGPYLII